MRIVDENSGKIFNFETDILILDVHGNKDYSDCQVVFKNPVPVYDASHTMIGSANLSVVNHILVANCAIDYATPERLHIQCDIMPLYAKPEGASVVYNNGLIESFKRYEINGVVVDTYPNEDPRVNSI